MIVGLKSDIIDPGARCVVQEGSAAFCSHVPEVYIENGYRGAGALDNHPLKGVVRPPRFDDWGSVVVGHVLTQVGALLLLMPRHMPSNDIWSCSIKVSILAVIEAMFSSPKRISSSTDDIDHLPVFTLVDLLRISCPNGIGEPPASRASSLASPRPQTWA